MNLFISMGPEKNNVKKTEAQKLTWRMVILLARMPMAGRAPESRNTGPVRLPANLGSARKPKAIRAKTKAKTWVHMQTFKN